jgi:2-oxo-3-hexenedioate decarboxylase/2-keto-4-pentenoate hydratase
MARAPRPLAHRLVEARRTGRRIARLFTSQRPGSLEEAYRVSREVAQALGPRGGWKIGATSAAAQRALGLQEPFFGAAPRTEILQSGAVWRSGRRPLTLDAEIVFEMAHAPPADDAVGLQGAVGWLRLGIEINDPSYIAPFALGGLAIVADNGAHAGLVLGPRVGVSFCPPLAETRATLYLDGEARGEGGGAAVMGDPWRALSWLAGALRTRGLGLEAGDVVASGALCSIEADRGSAVRVEAAAFGAVEVVIG